MKGWPWFPMYAADFTNSRKVRTMTPAQVGVYVLLLCHEWDAGALPDDMDELAALANHADPSDVRTVVERAFTLVDGRWQNERLESVRDEREARRIQQVQAGQASAKARRRNRLEGVNVRSTSVQRMCSKRDVEADTDTPPSVEAREGKAKRKRALPPDWKPNEGHHAQAKRDGLNVELEAEQFRDHHTAKGSVMLDWDAAFRTWLRNAVKFNARRRPSEDATDAILARQAEGWAERKRATEEAIARDLAKRQTAPPIANDPSGPLAGLVARVMPKAG